jgi:hypothetical protein
MATKSFLVGADRLRRVAVAIPILAIRAPIVPAVLVEEDATKTMMNRNPSFRPAKHVVVSERATLAGLIAAASCRSSLVFQTGNIFLLELKLARESVIQPYRYLS